MQTEALSPEEIENKWKRLNHPEHLAIKPMKTIVKYCSITGEEFEAILNK